MTDVTRILMAIEQGNSSASDELLPLVYQELRKLAAAKLDREDSGQTIQPTVLVHEAYLRLVDGDTTRHWNGRGHFFGAASEAMRRILIENARRKQSQRHGGGRQRLDLDLVNPGAADRDEELLALDEALTRLEQRWPDKAMLVKLRYFAGMTIPEASKTMGVSRATGERNWAFAKAWLHSQLKKDD
jgi:RNA polymerase sigma factor (TIGR02999 family)